ncbi:MAG TPA: aldo/keto reductase [Gemmatales bacterium]|nr:aldo/keto reductase [Gemmatales bacterium]
MRTFGKEAVPISEVGLGTWQLGGTEWGEISDDQALAVLQAAYEAGTTFFDTADIYGNGRSEQLIGTFLKKLGTASQSLCIASKLGRRMDSQNGWPGNFTLDAMRQHTQETLKRLGIEQLFLQQFHCIPFEVLQKGEVFEHMRQLQREGLIRFWGVSVETVEEGLFCLKQPGCAALQVIFNLFRQKLCDELLPKAQSQGVAILARVPLASGLLSGTFQTNQHFAPTDHRHFNAHGEKFNVGETFAGIPWEEGLKLVEQIRKILCPTEETPLAALALRWVLDHPAVSTVIPGATKPHQPRSNATASTLPPLSPVQHEQLRKLYTGEIHSKIRGRYEAPRHLTMKHHGT